MAEFQVVTLPMMDDQDERREVSLVVSQIVAIETINESQCCLDCTGGHQYRLPMPRAKAIAEINAQMSRQDR